MLHKGGPHAPHAAGGGGEAFFALGTKNSVSPHTEQECYISANTERAPHAEVLIPFSAKPRSVQESALAR